jgi:hypothetical protein
MEPTDGPTKSPWSEALFVEFLNSDSTGDNGVQQAQETSNPNKGLASEVKEELQNYNSLQYHFFCGRSWTHADNTCDTFCPSGDKDDCPDGQECYANTQCDGRDTPPPTISPAPTAKGNAGGSPAGAGGKDDGVELCTVCKGLSGLDKSKTVAFQTQTTTCGNIEDMLRTGNIAVGSSTCNAVHDQYGDSCCYDECQLCKTADGDFLDLRSDHLVKQGGYEATCSDISSILSTMDESDSTCKDAQSQLGEECCYRQCTLCGGESEMSTEWYATVSFQGLATTCLGLDYYLRADQIHEESETCSEFRGTYMDRCCYNENACQLCRADETLYEINPAKTVTIQQPSSTRQSTLSCSAIDDNMSKLDKDDQACGDGRKAFFGQCCNLNLIVGSDNDIETGGAPQPSPGQPSPGGRPSPGSRPNNMPGTGEAANSTVEEASTGPTSSLAPSPEGRRTVTNRPSKAFYWGDDEKPSYSWDQNWDPPSGCSQLAGRAAFVFMFVSCMSGLLFFI